MSTTVTGQFDSAKALSELKDPARIRRFIGLGARVEDLFDAYSRIVELEDWQRELSAIGALYEKAGETIEDKPVRVGNFLQAACYFHIATLGMFEDDDRRIELYRSVVRAYRKAAPDLPIPAEVVEYTFKDVPFSGYLRRPVGVANAPCILLLRGQDAVREVELHTISDFMLVRGFATFAIDAAGQGESRFVGLRMPDDLIESVDAAIDVLEATDGINTARLGLIGQSWGGHLAARIAAADTRIKAAIALGGFYSLADYKRNALAERNFIMNMGGDPDEAHRREGLFTLDGLIDQIRIPFFAANGAQDKVIPPTQTVKMYEHATHSAYRKLKLFEGLPHCAYYDNRSVLLELADWLHEVLPE